MTRRRFSNRRQTESFKFEHNGIAYRASVSRFEDGEIGELFLNAGKIGCAADIVAHDAAVIFSIARQYGVPLQTIKDALAKLPDCTPAGPIGVALELADRK
jgi:ABC-type spermidine/putrescine transport system permease subunit II